MLAERLLVAIVEALVLHYFMTGCVEILFLGLSSAANVGQAVYRRAREIEHKIYASQRRNPVVLIAKWAVRPGDLLQALNQHNVPIVHFSGCESAWNRSDEAHDGAENPIVGRDEPPLALTTDTLTRLFQSFSGTIRAVVLDSCHSSAQSRAVAKHIDCVIGIRGDASAEAVTTFAAVFYDSIGCGHSVARAFELGNTAVRREGLATGDVAELQSRRGADPAAIVLAGPPMLDHGQQSAGNTTSAPSLASLGAERGVRGHSTQRGRSLRFSLAALFASVAFALMLGSVFDRELDAIADRQRALDDIRERTEALEQQFETVYQRVDDSRKRLDQLRKQVKQRVDTRSHRELEEAVSGHQIGPGIVFETVPGHRGGPDSESEIAPGHGAVRDSAGPGRRSNEPKRAATGRSNQPDRAALRPNQRQRVTGESGPRWNKSRRRSGPKTRDTIAPKTRNTIGQRSTKPPTRSASESPDTAERSSAANRSRDRAEQTSSGQLDRATIARYIGLRRARIRHCYNEELIRDPDLTATLELEFLIDPAGNVRDVKARGVNRRVHRCAAEAIQTLVFPEVRNGEPVRVVYPFRLRPRKH